MAASSSQPPHLPATIGKLRNHSHYTTTAESFIALQYRSTYSEFYKRLKIQRIMSHGKCIINMLGVAGGTGMGLTLESTWGLIFNICLKICIKANSGLLIINFSSILMKQEKLQKYISNIKCLSTFIDFLNIINIFIHWENYVSLMHPWRLSSASLSVRFNIFGISDLEHFLKSLSH